ncbi:MAG: prepilin-type N-terminal cleavage/methylation domain-containing protein [Candidatus Omnitrophota bacterium]|nr:prepilin-type N-terminal cleavage/methylation domain-containing protein [Candidatus Omnitrophota bacterium]
MIKEKIGFTLIEIMIVVGVVLILATVAIPNMMRSKIVGNETSAIATLKVVTNACNLYAMNNSIYPTNIDNLVTNQNPAYISNDVYQAFPFTSILPKDGYRFNYGLTGTTGFWVRAQPFRYRVSGIRSFYCNESGLLTYCETQNCNPTPPGGTPIY